MLKKILSVLGMAILVLLVLLAGILFWAQRSGAELQERFFTAAVSGDPEQVLALCDPALRDEIDKPVLAAWMAEVRKQLGGYKGLSKTDFGTKVDARTEGTFRDSRGTVFFEHGEAKSELGFRNDLLIRFSIQSDKIGDDWFTGPADSTPYRDRGEQYIRRFFAKDAPGAREMMHDNLRTQVTEDKFNSMADDVVGKAGALRSIKYQEEKFTRDDGQTLNIRYRLQCDKTDVVANVGFRFIGMKGHLWGFDFETATRNGQ